MPPPKRICLINMPFASPEAPSIALTQLKAVLDGRFGDRVAVEILYPNLDFIEFIGGIEQYKRMTTGLGRLAGSSEWFFRAVAFPDAPDNTDEYLDRFYFDDADPETRLTKRLILEKRPALADFLDSLVDKHDLAAADIVGFTSMFYQTVASFAMARRIKAQQPSVVTVIGGAACEAEMGIEFARQVEAIDYAFSGPALVSFPEFVDKQLAGDREGCDQIGGVFSKTNLSLPRTDSCGGSDPGDAASLRLTGQELDINANIPLDYHSFLDRFGETFPAGGIRPMLMFETSRGCSWGEKIACTFCGLNGTAMHYRSMTPANALSQICALFDYLPRATFFLAVDTIVPKDYLDEVFPQLGTPPGTAMMYEVRPNLTESQLEILCEAGVLVIQPGIESLSTATLRLMRKGTTAFANILFLKRCGKLPLRVEWNLLIGSPGEEEATWEKYLRDIPLLAHLHPPTGAFPISFDRFSQYFIDPDRYGIDLQPQEYYSYAFPFEPDALANIAYHFIDRNSKRGSIDTWTGRLNEMIGVWWGRWDGSDRHEEAQLRLLREEDTLTIYDSRSGRAHEYAISEQAAEVLAHLDSPRRPEHIAAAFGEESAERDLAFLRENGLLFEEDGRLLSLVIA